MAKTRKTIVIALKVTAPVGMRAGHVKREVLTRINYIGPHFDSYMLDLPDSAEDDKGYLRVRASLAKRER